MLLKIPQLIPNEIKSELNKLPTISYHNLKDYEYKRIYSIFSMIIQSYIFKSKVISSINNDNTDI